MVATWKTGIVRDISAGSNRPTPRPAPIMEYPSLSPDVRRGEQPRRMTLFRIYRSSLPPVIGLAVAISMACGDGPASAPGEAHPYWEFDDPPAQVPDESHGSGLLTELATDLAASHMEWSIGSFDGPSYTVFGNPIDVAVIDSTVYILDAMANDVRAFTLDGEFLRTFGRQGQGPTELQFVNGIEPLPSAQLMIGMAEGLKIFSVTDSGIRLDRFHRVDETFPSPYHLCVAGGIAYVMSSNLRATENTIFPIDPAGRALPSFGKGYQYGSSLIRTELSDGLIACEEAGPTVVSALRYVPIVRGYDSRGRLLWTSELMDFEPLAWREGYDEDVGQTFGLDSGEPGDLVLAMSATPYGAAVLQVARLEAASRDSPGRQRIERVDTFVISTETGKGVFVSGALPRVLGVDHARLWGVEQDSLGVLRVVQLRYREERGR